MEEQGTGGNDPQTNGEQSVEVKIEEPIVNGVNSTGQVSELGEQPILNQAGGNEGEQVDSFNVGAQSGSSQPEPMDLSINFPEDTGEFPEGIPSIRQFLDAFYRSGAPNLFNDEALREEVRSALADLGDERVSRIRGQPLLSPLEDYSMTNLIGKSHLATMYAGQHNASGQMVCIKKYDKFVQQSGYSELSNLAHLGRFLAHENLVDHLASCQDLNNESLSIYTVHEQYRYSLRNLLRYTDVPDQMKHFFILAIMEALKYLHSNGIIHNQLRPSNVLLGPHGEIKLADVGQMLEADSSVRQSASLPYKSPEAHLPSYQLIPPVDIWSLGCIIIEICTQGPYFKVPPFDNEHLRIIIQICGIDDMNNLAVCRLIDHLGDLIPQRCPRKLKDDLYRIGIPGSLACLANRILQLDPSHRPTLAHLEYDDYFDCAQRISVSPDEFKTWLINQYSICSID